MNYYVISVPFSYLWRIINYMTKQQKIAKQVKMAMIRKGVTVHDVRRATGISHARIVQKVLDGKPYSINTLLLICEELDIKNLEL